MKTKILFLVSCFILTISMTFATTLTVCNDPLGGAQYTNLTDAYNAAVDGDTLIVVGTNIAYTYFEGGGQWTKSLTVIGSGFNTDKQLFKKTIFTYSGSPNYGWYLNFGTGSEGSSFYGIIFDWHVSFSAHVSNIAFEDCEFHYELKTNNRICNNLSVRNCIFNSDNNVNIDLPTYVSSTILISNCVFDGYINGRNNATGNYTIENCLFLSTSTSPFSGLQYASISNCIFMNYFPSGTTNCTYQNNICRVAGTFPPSGNSGSGNIENTDPSLATYTFNQHYSSTDDYHLQSGSPCTAAGVGGIDIGVHGGYTNFSEYGEVLIAPVVRSMHIYNNSVAPNGTLNVDISASKPHDN